MTIGQSNYLFVYNSLSLYFRLINPVVVSPTVAAVGLSFFSYGFTKVGSCIEMGVLQFMMVIIFALVSTEYTAKILLKTQLNIVCIPNSFYVDHLYISIDAVPPKNKVIWLPCFSNLCGKIWAIILIFCLILLIYGA